MRSRAVPIVRFRNLLIASIQMELTDELVLALRDDLSHEIARSSAAGVVIEISGIDVVDSFIAGAIRDLCQTARLLGVETVVAGLDPGMAITLVEMGMTMTGVRTALNLDGAVDQLQEAVARTESRDDELLHEILGDDAVEDVAG